MTRSAVAVAVGGVDFTFADRKLKQNIEVLRDIWSIEKIQRRLAWPLHKDDTLYKEIFNNFFAKFIKKFSCL